MYESFISYRRAKWLWLSLLLGAVSIGSLIWQSSVDRSQPPNGGTWVGYGLGTVAALLIVWLLYFGRRKRNYASTLGTVQGWLSAHVYLGTMLLLIATLHTGAQFGWNVHTLFYLLMCGVVFSGFFGVWAYLQYPGTLSTTLEGKTIDEMCRELADVDKQIRRNAQKLQAFLRSAIGSAIDRTSFGGGAWAQLTAKDSSEIVVDGSRHEPNSNQVRLVRLLAERSTQSTDRDEIGVLNQVMDMVSSRNQILRRIRRSIQIQAILRIWLYVHVPLSFATVAALVVHVVSVFVYW